MKVSNKPLILAVVVGLIVVAIFYLQSSQPSLPATQKVAVTASSNLSAARQQILKDKEAKYTKAIELVAPDGYINVNNISIGSLVGKKIILIDFWTYSCINCIRTIPYLNAWYDKYKNQGLEIIGVHTPEFDFEKNYSNVLRAVQKFGVKYPVVQDNNYFTWRAYNNHYWPNDYLIDIDGYIVYNHPGEGNYDETEQEIQKLLLEKAQVLNETMAVNQTMSSPENAIPVNFFGIGTPEIYLGYGFTRGNFGSPEGIQPEAVINYTIPSSILDSSVYLEGRWKNNNDNIELVSSTGRIVINYQAKTANIVASSANKATLQISLDKIAQAPVDVSDSQLYVVGNASSYGTHLLEMNVSTPGFRIYTFTFG